MKKFKPAIFLDRDGTLNMERGYVYKIEDFDYIDGALESLRQLQDWGYMLVIITNQSGIARGYYTEADFQNLTHWMLSDLERRKIYIDGVYYCPHHPEGKIKYYTRQCHCRKPGTELFYRAARELDVDFGKSVAVGDRLRDLEICKETGAKGVLLSDTDEKIPGIAVCKNWNMVIKSIGRIRDGTA